MFLGAMDAALFFQLCSVAVDAGVPTCSVDVISIDVSAFFRDNTDRLASGVKLLLLLLLVVVVVGC